MTILPIRTVPDPILKSETRPVSPNRFGTNELKTVLENMMDTMRDVNGVGLAGPQVGLDLAVFVYDLQGQSGHVFNPEISVDGETLNTPEEGCLSVPCLYYAPDRYSQATVTGMNVDGEVITISGEGLFARMLQHETDHLKGLLFVDRLDQETKRQARKAMAQASFDQVIQKTKSQRASTTTSSFGSFGQVN